MKVTLNEAMHLNQIIGTITDMSLPFSTSYKFSKLYAETQAVATFFQKEVSKMTETYGEKDEDGNFVTIDGNIKIQSDHLEECQALMAKLMDVDVDLPDIKFSLDEIGGNWTISDMLVLNKFIEE